MNLNPAIPMIFLAATLGIQFIILIVGSALAELTSRKSSMTHSLGLGTAFLLIVLYLLALLQLQRLVTSAIGIVAVASLTSLIFRYFKKPEKKAFIYFKFRELGVLALGGLLSFWIFIVPIARFTGLGNVYGAASSYNNDIANYAIGLRALLESGFGVSNHIAAMDYSRFVMDNYPGSNLFLLILGSFDSSNITWGILPTMMAILGILFSLFVDYSKKLFSDSGEIFKLKFLLPAALALCFPLGQYIASNYFLAQIFGTAAIVGVLSVAHASFESKTILSLQSFAGGFSWILVGLVCYSPLGVVALVTWLGFLGLELLRRFKYQTGRLKATYALVATLGFAILIHLCFRNVFALAAAQSKVLAGWPFPSFSPLGAFFDAQLLWFNFGNYLPILLWTAFITFGAWLGIYLIRESKISSIDLTIFFGLIFVSVLAAIYFGPHTYQGWKVVSYLLPLAVLYFHVFLLKLPRNFDYVTRSVSTVAIAAAIWAPQSNWGSLSQSIQGGIWTGTLGNLAANPKLEQLSVLNIKLAPFAESMFAAAIVPSESVNVLAETYIPKTIAMGSCTLVNSDSALGKLESSIKLNKDYSLAMIPSGCLATSDRSTRAKKVQTSPRVSGKLNSLPAKTVELFTFYGWHQVENWGVWSGAHAISVVDREFFCDGLKCRINLTFRVFGASESTPKTVHFNFGQHSKVKTYSDGSVKQLALNFPDTDEEMLLEILCEDATSPAAISASRDSRILGIGLERISN